MDDPMMELGWEVAEHIECGLPDHEVWLKEKDTLVADVRFEVPLVVVTPDRRRLEIARVVSFYDGEGGDRVLSAEVRIDWTGEVSELEEHQVPDAALRAVAEAADAAG